MQRVSTTRLQSGMVLARTLYNERGDVLLRRGVTLTPHYIRALQARGFFAIYVQDGIADDVEPDDVVFERVRVATRKHVNDLFAVAGSAAAKRAKDGGHDTLSKLGGVAGSHFALLCRDVERVVEDILNVETLPGVTSLKSHDNYSFEHSVEVTVAGVLLGRRLRLSLDDLHQLTLGCLLHDIGKLWVPQAILNKPGSLTPEEFSLVQQHPQVGYDMVKQITPDYAVIARQVVWQHHERQDGTGYPRGLRGSNGAGNSTPDRFERGRILGVAEIAAVADVYSALASDRPYRRALEPTKIVAILEEMAGSHLKRETVRRFLSILPTYPVGSQVVVIAGKLRGSRGVVTAVSPAAVDRPTVRILFDATGRSIAPFEVDTSRSDDVVLATPSYVEEKVTQ